MTDEHTVLGWCGHKAMAMLWCDDCHRQDQERIRALEAENAALQASNDRLWARTLELIAERDALRADLKKEQARVKALASPDTMRYDVIFKANEKIRVLKARVTELEAHLALHCNVEVIDGPGCEGDGRERYPPRAYIGTAPSMHDGPHEWTCLKCAAVIAAANPAAPFPEDMPTSMRGTRYEQPMCPVHGWAYTRKRGDSWFCFLTQTGEVTERVSESHWRVVRKPGAKA